MITKDMKADESMVVACEQAVELIETLIENETVKFEDVEIYYADLKRALAKSKGFSV